jgi:hypothetical protein
MCTVIRGADIITDKDSYPTKCWHYFHKLEKLLGLSKDLRFVLSLRLKQIYNQSFCWWKWHPHTNPQINSTENTLMGLTLILAGKGPLSRLRIPSCYRDYNGLWSSLNEATPSATTCRMSDNQWIYEKISFYFLIHVNLALIRWNS